MTLWVLTFATTIVLVAILNHRQLWRLIPIFVFCQCADICFSALLAWMYMSPRVDQETYHRVWVLVDIICILIEIFAAYEVLYCCKGKFAYWVGFLVLLHAIVKMYEYLQAEELLAYLPIYRWRSELNLILKILMLCSIHTLRCTENDHE